jgi:endonuclease YncB( thermonuclease family)
MQGIDAPEKDQPYSKESAEFISQYLNKDAVTVAHSHDKYGRTLGTLFVDSQNVNKISIRGGFSWHYKKYS